MAESNKIQKVKRGQRIMADTMNSIINKVEGKTRGTGGLLIDFDGRNLNMRQTNQGQFDRSGQKFREPFDLSVGVVEDKLAIDVVRSHLPNESGGFTDIPVGDPITFPQQEDVSIYLCELSSGGQKVMSSIDDGLSAAKTKTTLWTIKTNGLVLEDSRAAAIGGGDKIDLDLSSLNWVQVSSQTEGGETVWEDTSKAQLWDYGHLQDGDVADKSELTANNGWLFPVRPPDGTPHLKYVELSTLSSITGGGGCSCDLSVTPPATLSARGEDLIKIADWTKDNWQTHTEIYAPDSQLFIEEILARRRMTPFYYVGQEGQVATGQIRYNVFYFGRELKRVPDYNIVNQPGTYYLHIQTNQYGYYTAEIVKQDTTSYPIMPGNELQNTDTDTYYLLWMIPNAPYTKTTGIPFDYRHMYHLPFYSN